MHQLTPINRITFPAINKSFSINTLFKQINTISQHIFNNAIYASSREQGHYPPISTGSVNPGRRQEKRKSKNNPSQQGEINKPQSPSHSSHGIDRGERQGKRRGQNNTN